MEKLFAIPTAIQLCLDDVAWHEGADERMSGRPSRSGLPRRHEPQDYQVIGELGKAINMKILCPLCLGEWDKDNLLRGQIGITYDPRNWDRASQIDMPYARACMEAAESAEYLEYAVHGLLHGNYDENGKQLNESEYYIRKEVGGKMRGVPIPMDDFRRRLDIFEKIYQSWGFRKTIRAFVSPAGNPQDVAVEDLIGFAQELHKRGINYWSNSWRQFDEASLIGEVLCLAENLESGLLVPWNAYDFDPMTLCDFGAEGAQPMRNMLGMHWTNFLRFNPARNLEYLPGWIQYFRRQSEIFGLMLSKDIAFSANQQLYRQSARLRTEANRCTVDFTDVKAVRFPHRDVFYLSVKNGITPRDPKGGVMRLYEAHRCFRTYEIEHTADTFSFTF